jgi:hypothetical protein
MTDQTAGDERGSALPDGTDTVIAGASETGDTATMEDTALVTTDSKPAGSGGDRRLTDRFREGREQLTGQAGEKARGLVTQGLERTAEALANVSKMVGETAPGIEERLGPEYADYARRAAGSLENVANTIASKDPDELIEDTRNFVRNSPGVALAGAAVVGFVVARLLKTGLARDEDTDD